MSLGVIVTVTDATRCHPPGALSEAVGAVLSTVAVGGVDCAAEALPATSVETTVYAGRAPLVSAAETVKPVDR